MTLTNKRVLLTGAGGFVGSHLYRELKNQGAIVLAPAGKDGQRVDVRDWQGMAEFGQLMGHVDVVYHLAAKTFVPYSFANPRETFEINVLGTLNLLEICRLHSVGRLIYASSYVYGDPAYLPVDEKHPAMPNNPYARSKLIGETLCKAFHDDYGLKCIILRPFNIFGEEQDSAFLIPSILAMIERGKIELMDPDPRRDFLYIADAVDAYMKAGDYAGADFGVFNIGSGCSYSVREIVDQVVVEWGDSVSVGYRNSRRRNEVMDVVANIDKARQSLGWEPRIGLREGLSRYVAWYKSQPKSGV